MLVNPQRKTVWSFFSKIEVSYSTETGLLGLHLKSFQSHG